MCASPCARVSCGTIGCPDGWRNLCWFYLPLSLPAPLFVLTPGSPSCSQIVGFFRASPASLPHLCMWQCIDADSPAGSLRSHHGCRGPQEGTQGLLGIGGRGKASPGRGSDICWGLAARENKEASFFFSLWYLVINRFFIMKCTCYHWKKSLINSILMCLSSLISLKCWSWPTKLFSHLNKIHQWGWKLKKKKVILKYRLGGAQGVRGPMVKRGQERKTESNPEVPWPLVEYVCC